MLQYLAPLTLFLLLISHTTAQVITLTEYPSACSATYGNPPETITKTTTSIVTITPIPTGTELEDGNPFVIRIDQPGFPYLLGLSAPSYLAVNGASVSSRTDAAKFELANGTLILLQTGGLVGTLESFNTSLFPSVPAGYSPISKRVAAITTTFAVVNTTLTWNNTAFANGSASWYMSNSTTDGTSRVYARFGGQAEAGDVAVTLVAQEGMSYGQA